MRFVSEICELVLKTLVPNERVTLVGGGRVWQDVAEDAAGRLLGGAWAALGGWFWVGGSGRRTLPPSCPSVFMLSSVLVRFLAGSSIVMCCVAYDVSHGSS